MKITSNLTYISHFEGVRILPGESVISDEDYSKFKDHPIFLNKENEGYFQVDEKVSSLIEMVQKNAIDFIRNSIDIEFLKIELNKEKRKIVKSEIEKRLLELNLENKEALENTEESK